MSQSFVYAKHGYQMLSSSHSVKFNVGVVYMGTLDMGY